jgi:hypothetical protein
MSTLTETAVETPAAAAVITSTPGVRKSMYWPP